MAAETDRNDELTALRRLVEEQSNEFATLRRTVEEQSSELTALRRTVEEQSNELSALRQSLKATPGIGTKQDREYDARLETRVPKGASISLVHGPSTPNADGVRARSREVSAARAREWLQTPPLSVSGSTKSESRAASDAVAELYNEWGQAFTTLDTEVPPWVKRQKAAEQQPRAIKRKASPDTLNTTNSFPLAPRRTFCKRSRMVPEVVVPTLTPEARRLYIPPSPPPSKCRGKEAETHEEDEGCGDEDDWETSSLSSLSTLTSLSSLSSLDSLSGPPATGALEATPQLPPREQATSIAAIVGDRLEVRRSTARTPPPDFGDQNGARALQQEQRLRGSSRELSYVDAGWPVCPQPHPDEAPPEIPPANELPPPLSPSGMPRESEDIEPPSDPVPSQQATRFTPKSESRTISSPRPATRQLASVNRASSVGHSQRSLEVPGDPLMPSHTRAATPALSSHAQPTAGTSVVNKGSALKTERTRNGPQAGPSNHAQHPAKKSKKTRRTSPTVAGVKVKLGSPLMDHAAAQQRLEGASRYQVHVDAALHALTVDRIFMATTFGGHIQRLSAQVEGRSFLYPTLAMDPELPVEFGMPGLLCRACRLREWGGGPQRLFVGLRSGHFRYVGEYELTLSTPLSVEEYRALAPEVKVKWAEAISKKMKHKDIRVRVLLRRQYGREPTELELVAAVADGDHAYDNLLLDNIIHDYEAGLETMFIWRMQCVGFDLDFLRRVARARATYVPKPRAKRAKPGKNAAAGDRTPTPDLEV